jgi:hypothetical protein
MVLTGHCNCTAIIITIEYTSAGEPELSSIYCHCTTCKRQSAAFGTCFVIVDDEKVKIDDPQGVQRTWVDTLTDSGVKMDRQFCGVCGWWVLLFPLLVEVGFVGQRGGGDGAAFL